MDIYGTHTTHTEAQHTCVLRLCGDAPFISSSEEKLFEKIKKGELSLSGSVWDTVSDAGDLCFFR